MSALYAKIEQVLEDHVRPVLAMHSGDICIVSLDEDAAEVHVQFLGSCRGCPITSITFYHVVEKAILEEIPEIRRVIDVDSGE